MKFIITIYLLTLYLTVLSQDSIVKTEFGDKFEYTKCDIPYKNGQIHGIKSCYSKYPLGSDLETWYYKDGNLHGAHKQIIFEENDTITTVLEYYKNGYLDSISFFFEINVSRSKTYCYWTTIPYDRDTSKRIYFYLWRKTYAENGLLGHEENMDSAGLRHGISYRRLPNGDTLDYKKHSHGRLIVSKKFDIVRDSLREEHSVLIEITEYYDVKYSEDYLKKRVKYFHNGRIQSEEYYLENHAKTGIWKSYDHTGKLIKKEKYKTKKNAP